MYYQRPLVFLVAESLCRHWRLFACTSLVIIGLVTVFVITRPRTFNTQYTVELNGDSIQNPLANDATGTNFNIVQQTIDHFQTLIQTKEFIQTALTSTDGTPIRLNHPINLRSSEAISELQKSISVWAGGTDSFNVGVSYSDPRDSVTILTAVINAYIDRNAEEKSAFYTSQVAFIRGEVDACRDKLTKAGEALAAFKTVNAQHLPSQQDAIEQQLANLKQTVQQDTVTLAEDQSRAAWMTQQLAQTPKTIVGSQTTGASPLETQIRALQVKLDTDLSVMGMKANHPEVKTLKTQIAALEAQLRKQTKAGALDSSGTISTDVEQNPEYFQLASGLSNLKSDMQGLQTEISSTQQLIQQTQVGVSKVPEEELIEGNLDRDYSYDNDQYGTLYKRMQQANIDEQLYLRQQRSMFAMYPTQPPTSSTSKKKMAILFLGGLFIALVVAGAMVILSEALDRSFRDPYDLQRTLGVPVLAMLPDSPDLHVADSRHPQLPGGSFRNRLLGGRSRALLTGPRASGSTSVSIVADDDARDDSAGEPGLDPGPTEGVGGTV